MFKVFKKNMPLSSVLILGLVLKFAIFIILYRHHADFTLQDTPSYLDPAKRILLHPLSLFTHGLWERTPGYPLFLVGVFKLTTVSVIPVVILQTVLSVLIVWNGYRIALLLFNRSTALVAAILLSLSPLIISYSLLVLSDLLFSAVFSFFLYFITRFLKTEPSYKYLFLAGLFLALATFIRPVSYYLVPLLSIFLCIYLYQRKPSQWPMYLCLFLLSPVMLIGGWQLRNKMVYGSYQYTMIDAYNLYHYYAANAVAESQGRQTKDVEKEMDAKANGMHFPERRLRYDYYRKEGMRLLFTHFPYSIKQFASGCIRTLFGVDYILFYYNQSEFAHGKGLKNLLIQDNVDGFVKHLGMSDFLKLFTLGLILMLNIIIALCAGYTLVYKFKEQGSDKTVIICMMIILGYFLLVSSNYCSVARFRMPFEMLLMVFAAGPLGSIISKFKFIIQRNVHAQSC